MQRSLFRLEYRIIVRDRTSPNKDGNDDVGNAGRETCFKTRPSLFHSLGALRHGVNSFECTRKTMSETEEH